VPSPIRHLTRDHIDRFVAEQVFAPTGEGRVGIELEWVTVDTRTGRVPSPATLRDLLPEHLPGASTLTFEPGGQLELSGPPGTGIAAACEAMADDTAIARRALAAHGVELVGIGVDPHGTRPRLLDAPRYQAMEQYFDTRWPAGRTMMRSTAAIQVNLDVGTPDDLETRWQRAHDLGPVLAAAFANSPFDTHGAPTGWHSSRLAVWHRIDPQRTAPAYVPGVDAARAWADYALAAPVMMVRVDDDHRVALTRPLTFADWIAGGHELGWPTVDDLELHLTTLFPPVRPRGWLELRMIDALPDEWWPVAVGVTAALIDEPEAAALAADAVAPVRDRWAVAARDALRDPALRAAADRCFSAALGALRRLDADPGTVAATATFYDRYVARGRCPADDRLDEWAELQAAHA
jgi:glutamate--cysteine ligase